MTDLDLLANRLTEIAGLSQSAAYVAVRGYGSGGWYAGCKLDDEHLSEDASGPVEAVAALGRAVESRLRQRLAAAESEAARLRARLGAMD